MLILYFFLSFGLQAYAQSPSSLGDFPLAVKTPYLHAWTRNADGNAPQHVWPQLFTQGHILAWNAMVRVDGQPYQWLGSSNPNVANFSATTSSEITPTSTIFTIQAGPIKFKATFFTPIEPNDYIRQSIPFTYLFVNGFVADDGNPHTIQLYTDITGEWISHDTATQMKWGTQDSPDNMVYHHLEPRNPKSMIDNADSAEDATAYYATPKRSGLTWQTGAGTDCRTRFAQNGSLTNAKDTEFRPVNSKWPVFSFAIDLGSITPTTQPDPVVWALGLVRDPLVNYSAGSGFQPRIGYYWSAYHSIDDVISDFLGDFASARVRGQAFDDSLLKAASAISPEYAGIISLVTRQIFASMDITIAAGQRGRTSPSDVKIFMKDISVSNRANPVEVIYAALPALLYFNSSLAHDLLLPLFEFQSSSSYPNGYASPDLGSGYPTIGGNTSATEELAIEHCGNMLIMAYAHAAKSGDGSLISKYHSLLQKWAAYLVQNSLHPNNAVSADGISYPGMSNLALKGILGVYSMGKIDEHVNPSNTTFKDKANELFQNWKQLAVTDTHIQAEYGKPGTWGLMYNLFPAVWLEAGLIDDEILNREAQFYLSQAPPGDRSYSLDDDAASDIAYPHWSLMTAAIMPSGFTSVRDTLIKSTHFQAYNISQQFPLPMRYTASTGVASFGTTGSAAQGAAFGLLAMNLKNVEISRSNSGGSGNVEKRTPIGAIVGGVIGGLAFVLIVAAAIFFWRRRRVRHPRGVIDLHDKHNAKPYAPVNNNDSAFQFPQQLSDASLSPPTWQGSLSEPFSDPQPSESSLSYASGRNHMSVTPTSPITAPQPLSSKQREILRHNQSHQSQPSVSAVSTLTNPWSATGSGREEVLRAEVGELRRGMEAIRNIAQPPPRSDSIRGGSPVMRRP